MPKYWQCAPCCEEGRGNGGLDQGEVASFAAEKKRKHSREI